MQADTGIVDAADYLVGQVVLPVKRIYKATNRVERHCVDGEIASRQVLLDGVNEQHAIGAVSYTHLKQARVDRLREAVLARFAGTLLIGRAADTVMVICVR